MSLSIRKADEQELCGQLRSDLIRIGRCLATPLLLHHRTYESRIQRFGRESQRVKLLTGRQLRHARTPVSSLTLSDSDFRLTDALPRFFTSKPFLSFHPPSENRSGLHPTFSRTVGSEKAPLGACPPSGAQTRRAAFPHRAFKSIALTGRRKRRYECDKVNKTYFSPLVNLVH
jgi:hypothetical protein